MIRVLSLIALTASVGVVAGQGAAPAGDPKKGDAAVIAIQRGGGFVNPAANPFAYYWFNVAKDGAWEMKGLKGEPKKGKIGADEVGKWMKEIEDGGFTKMKSNPALGAADEPYMDITVRAGDKKDQRRIRLEEKLAQTLEKKIFELTKVGK